MESGETLRACLRGLGVGSGRLGAHKLYIAGLRITLDRTGKGLLDS